MSYEIQPAHHNQQPTHQLGLAKNDQNCQFWVKVGPINGKILCFTRESKSFCTHITEKHLSNLSALFFGQAQDKMGQKCQYLANNNQKCIFWTNFGRFWAKNPNSYRRNQKFLYPHNGKTTRATCPHFFQGASDQMGQKSQYLAKYGHF